MVCSRLARFYVDVQELLFSDTEFQQLGRLWRDVAYFSNFMDTLRRNPSSVSGKGRITQLKRQRSLSLVNEAALRKNLKLYLNLPGDIRLAAALSAHPACRHFLFLSEALCLSCQVAKLVWFMVAGAAFNCRV